MQFRTYVLVFEYLIAVRINALYSQYLPSRRRRSKPQCEQKREESEENAEKGGKLERGEPESH